MKRGNSYVFLITQRARGRDNYSANVRYAANADPPNGCALLDAAQKSWRGSHPEVTKADGQPSPSFAE